MSGETYNIGDRVRIVKPGHPHDGQETEVFDVLYMLRGHGSAHPHEVVPVDDGDWSVADGEGDTGTVVG